MGCFSQAFLVMKESKNRRRKQPGKLMAKSRSQPVNFPGLNIPLASPWIFNQKRDLLVQLLASIQKRYMQSLRCLSTGINPVVSP